MPIQYSNGQLAMATPFGELQGASTAELNAELDKYVELGVDVVRTDFWWTWLQPTKDGPYNWTAWDNVVNAAAARGIEVIGELNGGPAWGGSGMTSETDQKEWAEFAGAAAAHFGNKVNTWEIFNEQNMAGISPANYTKMLKSSYAAIKAVDSTDVVVTGGLAPAPESGANHVGAVDYLKGMYAAGAKGSFDHVGFHPYTYPLMPNDSAPWNGWQIMEDGIRGTMVANGDGAKDVWITELGVPTAGGGNDMTEAEQAAVLQQSVDLAKGTDWAGPIFWYSYKDRGGSTSDTENWFGLVRPDGSQKPAFNTFKNIATGDGPSSPDPEPTPAPTPTPTPEPAPTETPTFTGANYWGDSAANTIIGNDLNNAIYGQGGADVIKGGLGADKLDGGAGIDKLWGGGGNDVFDFNSSSTAQYDGILDFAKGDKIDLSTIDANAKSWGNQTFKFIGSNWLANPGDLGFYQDAADGVTHVQGDLDGNDLPDFSIRVSGIHAFAAADFIL